MNTSLYHISQDLAAIMSEIEANDGEITPEIEAALTINQEQFAAKAEDYGHAILNLEAMAKAAKAEKDRLASLQKYYDNVAQRLRGAILNAMEVFGQPKVENATLRLSTRRTTATEIDDLTQLPKEYKTIKVEEVADKTAIKKAIQSGEDVPGAHLVENVSLQIK